MAPPRKDPDTTAVDNLKALAILMASDSNFNPDYDIVATEIGIAQSKNVPRKIDSILKPAGYQIKSKKVIKIGDDVPPATPSKVSTKRKEPKTPGASDAEDDGVDEEKPVKSAGRKSPTKKKEPTTPKSGAAKSPRKKAAADTPAPASKSKKRKVDEVVKEEDENEAQDDEAMEMIKEKMGDGTDDEDGDEDMANDD